MKSFFDGHYKKYDRWYDKNEYVYLSELEAVRKAVPKRGRGLEIGIGTGRFASPLKVKYGIDVSYNMLKMAEKRGGVVSLAKGEILPFRGESFDYALIVVTICFVKDPVKVLEESFRVLKKGGKVILGIVDEDSFLGGHYQTKKSIFYKQAVFFSIKSITRLLKRAGFGKFSYYQTIFRLPAEISAVEKTEKGFGRGGFVVIKGRK